MYLGERQIDEVLTFYAQCVDTGGSAADATGVPSYNIYEEETGAPIVSSTMTLLGGAGSGFYSEQITLAAVTGYEVGKWYAIRINATVDGETPASFHTFKVAEAHATAAALANVQADTDNIQTRLPGALVGGRMDSSVGAMAANVVTAAAVATDAIDADALAADAVAEIAAASAGTDWDELKTAHQGQTIMGNIAEDLDAMEFTGEEG